VKAANRWTPDHRLSVVVRYGELVGDLECLDSCPRETIDLDTGEVIPGEGCWAQSWFDEGESGYTLAGEWPANCWPALAVAEFDEGSGLTLHYVPDPTPWRGAAV
jgi:hypothetical protein